MELLVDKNIMSGLGTLTVLEIGFIGIVLEGFFYGLYSAIFAMYIQHRAINKTKNILIYPLCLLFILSTATFALDISNNVALVPNHNSTFEPQKYLRLYLVLTTITGLCDFVSQTILIYRCWIVWSCDIRVVIIPSILSLVFLCTWLATNWAVVILPVPQIPQIINTRWGFISTMTALAISLTVNAIVTGLIMFRILKVYREVRPTMEDPTLGGGGSKLRSVIFVIIESGMAMFATQLIRIVLGILNLDAVYLIIGSNGMFHGITPTIILVRLSMGLSFHDQTSMMETAGSLRFASHPIAAVGNVDIADQQSRHSIIVEGFGCDDNEIAGQEGRDPICHLDGSDSLKVMEEKRDHIGIERLGSDEIKNLNR